MQSVGIKDSVILVFNGKLSVIVETSQLKDFNGLGLANVKIDVQETQIKFAEDRSPCLFIRFGVITDHKANSKILNDSGPE